MAIVWEPPSLVGIPGREEHVIFRRHGFVLSCSKFWAQAAEMAQRVNGSYCRA